MATTSLLRLPLHRGGSGSIGEDRRQLCSNRPVFSDALWAALRRDALNSPLARFMKPTPVVAMASSRHWVPSASVPSAVGLIDDRFRNWGTARRILYGVRGARSGGRGRCCTGTSNVGHETGANRVKGEGGVEIKQGEEDELVVSSSALGKFWQGTEGGAVREAYDNGASSLGPQNVNDVEKDLDSAVFSPSDRVAQGNPGGLRHSFEDGRISVPEEVSQYADSNGVVHDSTETELQSPGSGGASPKDNRSDYKPQAKVEPVFLEVIPEDLVRIHPDLSDTVGLFDGQQPLRVVEQAQKEADVEPAKEWDWWPSGLQEDQIKIKPDVQGKYGREMAAAIQAVQLACMLSQRVQERLLRHEEKAGSKKDKSLITVADWGVQAVVSWVLTQSFQGEELSMVAEEDTKGLRGQSGVDMSQRVVNAVNECLCEASVVGIAPPKQPLGSYEVLKFINKGTALGGPTGRHWVLDPVDGTLGFVRGDQYAVALALVDDGEVVLGVLGCPNFPMRTAWLGYHHRYYRLAMQIAPPDPSLWHRGCVMTAQKGEGRAWMQPMIFNGETFNEFHAPREVSVSSVVDPADATFCEPVEKANSSHSFTAGLADTLGLRNEPLRVYSMAKYAAIARGDAEIFMKFAKAGYKEKIWDHAAGVLIVQEAGGVVTDAGGRPLDFSKGRFLEGLDRGIVACCGKSLHNKIIAAVDASYNSSTL
ncbi:hypothetical protein M758_1G088900 [Ceratodon purpureus]|nr:hypothetical protein M758_1G088900 [Ceratodon purpureus]KAG0629253.1 hypothetical protein M758_1G088900 [Ceratodon purpureus]KAG0629254.1 hypothetical protein M758_1G088900 [Ceratodon purpureus]